MRNLFLALVLLNLAYAAWTAWFAEPARPASTPSATGLPILLVSEAGTAPDARSGVPVVRAETPATAAVETTDGAAAEPAAGGASSPEPASAGGSSPQPAAAGASSPDPAAAGASDAEPTARGALLVAAAPEPRIAVAPPVLPARGPPAASSSGERCISIGPFADGTASEAASAALSTAGYAPVERSTDGEIWVGFWVHIAAIPSRAEANAMLGLLRENGLPDAYLIPGEEDGDIISLGVFNNMTRAGRLDTQVREIGLVPTIVERSRQAVVRWLDVAVPAGRELDLEALGIRQNRLEQRACDEV